MDDKKNKIGFTSTTFRRIGDLGKIVGIARESGADCIEWGGDVHVIDVETAKTAKRLCDENGVGICSYGSYYRVGTRDVGEWKRICEIAETMSADSVRVWLGTKGSGGTDERYYARILEDLRDMCRVAAAHGLIVEPECHVHTYNDDTDCFLRIAKDADCANLATYFQSKYKDMDYDLDRIERTFPYIDKVHISYSEMRREQFFAKRRSDYIDRLLDKLLSIGFGGTILIEYTRFGLPSRFYKEIKRLRDYVGRGGGQS